MILSSKISKVKIFGDSQFIINQIAGSYKVINPRLHLSHQAFLEQIPEVSFFKIPRSMNSRADVLAKLAKELSEIPLHVTIQTRPVLLPPVKKLINSISTPTDKKDWRQDLIDYL